MKQRFRLAILQSNMSSPSCYGVATLSVRACDYICCISYRDITGLVRAVLGDIYSLIRVRHGHLS